MQKHDIHKKNEYYLYIPTLMGVTIGTFGYLLRMDQVQAMWMGVENYKIDTVGNFPTWNMVGYIMNQRGIQIALFILLAALFSYVISSFLFCFLFGIYYGITTCSLLIHFGFQGLFYGYVLFFPHFFFYFVALALGSRIFTVNKREQETVLYPKMQFAIEIIVIVSFLLLGMVWEMRFQNKIIKIFFQHLV